MKYFSSTIISNDGITYKAELHSESYIGLNGPISGGSVNVFYLAYNWSDYLQNNQALSFGDTTISAAYKARVLADGGTFENEDCLKEFLGETDTVVSFTYNVGEDRTEITLANSVFGTQTIIKNDVTNAASFVPSFSPRIQGLETEWKNEDDIIISSLMTSSTSIIFANRDAYFDRFLDFYLTINDDDMRLVVYREVSGAYELEWAGNIVADLIEWDNVSKPRPYTFKAIDGIDRIRDVFYDGDITSLNLSKVIVIIKNILDLNGLDQFWGASETYIRDSIEYSTPNIAGINSTSSILDYSYMPENLLLEKEGKSETRFKTGRDSLKGILELFGARIVHCDGMYWVHQIRNYDAISTFRYRDFNKTSNIYTTALYGFKNSGLIPMAMGKFGNMYGIKRASIETVGSDTIRFATATDSYSLLYTDTNTKIREPNSTTLLNPEISFNVGNVVGGLSIGNSFVVALDAKAIQSGGLGLTAFKFQLEMRLHITSGNKYLAGGFSIAPYWGDDLITVKRYWNKIIDSRDLDWRKLQWDTPVIPYDIDNAEIKIEFIITKLTGGAVPAYHTLFLTKELEIFTPTDRSQGSEEIYIDNPSTAFTKDLDLGQLIINEGNNLISTNTLSVNTNYLGAGSVTLEEVNLWDGDFDTNMSLSSLRVAEAMSLQFKPLQKYMGKFDGDYYPIQTIQYNNKTFACMNMRKDYTFDENDGMWFEVITARAGLTSNVDLGDYSTGEGQGETMMMNYFQEKESLGFVTEEIFAATITSLPCDITDFSEIKNGDTFRLIYEDTKETLLTFVCAADMVVTDTAMSINSKVVEFDIPAGVTIIRDYKDFVGEVVRFDTLQTTGVAGVPTIAVPMLSNEIRYVDGNIYIENGSDVYKFTGTIYIPE
tara:strand:+ start:160 stop:2814 length:2655 start_codon:yes stop_codon:yes gene_type:complete